jgi:hypothetical protein
VHGELLKLGIEISERTVSRLMPKKQTGPSQTCKTFLANHIGQLVSIDFFTVPTVQLRVLLVFVVLAHQRRRVIGLVSQSYCPHRTIARHVRRSLYYHPDAPPCRNRGAESKLQKTSFPSFAVLPRKIAHFQTHSVRFPAGRRVSTSSWTSPLDVEAPQLDVVLAVVEGG